MIKGYYLEDVRVITADDAGIVQDGVLVHMYGDTFSESDCILAGCKSEDFKDDDEIETAVVTSDPIFYWWEDAAGVMHQYIPGELTDEELEIRPDDDEEA